MERIKASPTIKTVSNQSHSVDEHHTLHTKLLSNATCAVETDLTNVNTDQSFCSLDDFTGGPIYHNQSSDFHSCDQNTELNSSITTTPADSSGGFHNTLSVLECHLNKNKSPNLSQQQIELLHRKDIAIHNNSYIDIPIDNTNNESNSIVEDGNLSSLFELELEAMARLQSMWVENISLDNLESSSTSPDLHLSSTQGEHSVPKSNEYIYHVARSRNGQLYLRVRRNSCLDQGIKSVIFLCDYY